MLERLATRWNRVPIQYRDNFFAFVLPVLAIGLYLLVR
jgi:hypothetical protein